MSVDANVQPQPLHNPDDAQSLVGRWLKVVLLVVVAVGLLATTAFAVISGVGKPDDSGHTMTHTVTRGSLTVSVTEQGTLESSNNTEIKCKVRGFSNVTFIIPDGTVVAEGDVLAELDTKIIEETVSLQKTNVHIATATLERSKADVSKAKIAIDAYENGRLQFELLTLEKQLAIANSNLETAQQIQDQSELLFLRGYVSDLEVESNEFAVTQADLVRKVIDTQIFVLKEYTSKMELETLNGNLIANKSKLQADEAGLAMDVARRERAKEELENCTIRAPRGGLVIYPSAAAWKDAPDVAEGATVRHDQVILLMPDLEKMQVAVGVHESMISRVKEGLDVNITLPDRSLKAKVSRVATVTSPAGWWSGNVVKYDTVIDLPTEEGLKPGMSAEVEIVVARHEDVLTVPVAAILETDTGAFCWVKVGDETRKRILKLGDGNDVFVIVEAGLKEGDEVVLNPNAVIDEADGPGQSDAAEPPSRSGRYGESSAAETPQAGGDENVD